VPDALPVIEMCPSGSARNEPARPVAVPAVAARHESVPAVVAQNEAVPAVAARHEVALDAAPVAARHEAARHEAVPESVDLRHTPAEDIQPPAVESKNARAGDPQAENIESESRQADHTRGGDESSIRALFDEEMPLMQHGMNGMNGVIGMNGINRMNSMNNMAAMNGMATMPGMYSINAMHGVNAMSAIHGMNAMNRVGRMSSMNGINKVNGINTRNRMNAMNAMDAMNGMNGNFPFPGFHGMINGIPGAPLAHQISSGMSGTNMAGQLPPSDAADETSNVSRRVSSRSGDTACSSRSDAVCTRRTMVSACVSVVTEDTTAVPIVCTRSLKPSKEARRFFAPCRTRSFSRTTQGTVEKTVLREVSGRVCEVLTASSRGSSAWFTHATALKSSGGVSKSVGRGRLACCVDISVGSFVAVILSVGATLKLVIDNVAGWRRQRMEHGGKKKFDSEKEEIGEETGTMVAYFLYTSRTHIMLPTRCYVGTTDMRLLGRLW